jgi:hypothetical protein
MSSSALTNADVKRADEETTQTPSLHFRRGTKISLLVAAAIICAAASLATLFWNQIWPFTKKAVVQDLQESSDSTVTVRSFHRTYFPSPGCVLEGVEFHHGARQFKLITIDKLTIEGSYSGILTKHIPRIRVEGGHVFIPPFGSNLSFQTQHSSLVIEEIIANGTIVEFASKDPHGEPLRFGLSEAVLRDVRWGSPFTYQLKVQNPEPPGEIATRGKFGAWATGNPGETPISGEYTFERADLSYYEGIAGTLASKGNYGGVLKHIDIRGTTDVPDFEVKSGGHKVQLVTQFTAFVDAIHGDTFLQRVNARFGRTNLIVAGSVAGVKGRPRKTAFLNFTSPQGRIEDILGLFVQSPRSPMSGATTLTGQVEIPSGDQPFLKKVRIQGKFGIDAGKFSSSPTQKDVNKLSAGARGEKTEDAETVLTDLKGQVTLQSGVSSFSGLSFGVPGAKARMYGAYNLLNEKIDLHGRLWVDTQISKTETGIKAQLLKAMNPFFKKKRKGEVVPVHIGGTYDHPEFGLDVKP